MGNRLNVVMQSLRTFGDGGGGCEQCCLSVMSKGMEISYSRLLKRGLVQNPVNSSMCILIIQNLKFRCFLAIGR